MTIERKPDFPISDSVNLLRTHIKQINTVGEWAYALDYSRPHFNELIKDEFGDTPYEIIKKEKLKKIKELLKKNPQQKGFLIAREAGFDDMQSLCSFLSWNFDTCLTHLRSQLISSSLV